MDISRKNYSTTVAFIDSGIGGLVFAIDSIKKMNEICKNSNANNQANHTLNFVHIGDTKNVPYGLKTPSQLVGFVEDLLEKCKKLDAKIVVIACNTASTVLDKAFLNKYRKRGLQIILIIKKSAEVLYNSTPVIDNEKRILVLGTKQTISSNKYFEALLNLHNPNNSKLFIHQYSPSRWEQEIENGINRNKIQDMVDEDFAKIHQEIGDDFTKIASVGLFCTHYPYFTKEIHANLSFHANIGSNITLIPQGDIFAQEILDSFVGNVQIDVNIKSYITGGDLTPIQNAIDNIYQSFPVTFEKI